MSSENELAKTEALIFHYSFSKIHIFCHNVRFVLRLANSHISLNLLLYENTTAIKWKFTNNSLSICVPVVASIPKEHS